MKKMMTIGLAAVFAAGFASAQEDVVMVGQPVSGGATISAEAALLSSYVWRGQVINNDAVIQPQVTVAQGDFSLNVWGNHDLVEGTAGKTGEFTEIDLTLAYSLPVEINEMTFDVGLINYNFPNTTDSDTGNAVESTTEIFVAATFQSFKDWFIPSITLFGDIDEVRGTYVLFDVVAPYQVSEYFAIEGGLSAGYGNTSYNTSYWADEADAGFNDYNIYANAAYEIADNVTISANMTYTMLEGGVIRDSADSYENDKKFWGGVSVAYDF